MFTFSQLWKQNKAEQECFLVLTSDMLFNIAFGDDNWLWRGIPGVFSPWRCLLDPSWELQAFADVRATIDEATLMIWLKLYMPHQEVFARHRWNEREILLHSFFFFWQWFRPFQMASDFQQRASSAPREAGGWLMKHGWFYPPSWSYPALFPPLLRQKRSGQAAEA